MQSCQVEVTHRSTDDGNDRSGAVEVAYLLLYIWFIETFIAKFTKLPKHKLETVLQP